MNEKTTKTIERKPSAKHHRQLSATTIAGLAALPVATLEVIILHGVQTVDRIE